jgi:hypothetical protein
MWVAQRSGVKSSVSQVIRTALLARQSAGAVLPAVHAAATIW